MNNHTRQTQLQAAGEYPLDGNTAIPCWYATIYGIESLHGDCAIETVNAWDSREFQCDCPCHKLNEESNDNATTSNGK